MCVQRVSVCSRTHVHVRICAYVHAYCKMRDGAIAHYYLLEVARAFQSCMHVYLCVCVCARARVYDHIEQHECMCLVI